VHLQTFLDSPKLKIIEFTQNSQMKHEERERKIAYYASYFCVASLQYFVPVFITLTAALLLKSFGAIQISALWGEYADAKSPAISESTLDKNSILHLVLEKDIQRPIWTLLLVVCLGINASLSICGVVFKRTLLTRA